MVSNAKSQITNVPSNPKFREQALIGIHYDEASRLWLDAFNAPLKRFNWAVSYHDKKQPSGGTKQKCVTTIAGPVGEWNDVECEYNFAFICEKNI